MTDNKQSKAVSAADNRPSILFASPMNILDISSGAALSMRTILAQLVKRGWRAVALGATLFDSAHGGEHVLKAGENVEKDKKILRSQVLGIECLIVRTKATRRPDMTCQEQQYYYDAYLKELKERRPDVVVLWGGMLLETNIMRDAAALGIPVVFYLVNSGYKWETTFQHVSAVITDTHATAKMYWDMHKLRCHPIGKFIDNDLVKAPKREPEFITFINPSFEKGVHVFMPMAKLAAEKYPDIRFLVVQSRVRWVNALKILNYKPEDFPNVQIAGHQKVMKNVYAKSKAVLLPSVWEESGARVISESLINGIPVIGSRTGGTAELVGEGGVVLEIPEDVRENRKQPAPEPIASEWLEVVNKVWNDEDYYQSLCEGVAREAPKHDIDANVDKLLKVVQPLIDSSKGKKGVNLDGLLAFEHTRPPVSRGAVKKVVTNRKQKRAIAAKKRSSNKKKAKK